MVRRRAPLGAPGGGGLPNHSIRLTPEVAARAKRRAEHEGYSFTHVLQELTRGYAEGMINLPRIVRVYDPPGAPPGAGTQESKPA